MSSSPIRRFFLPTLTERYFLRLILVALACYLIFGHIIIHLRIQWASMDSTHSDGSFAFCWRLQYLFSQPEGSDVVTVRYRSDWELPPNLLTENYLFRFGLLSNEAMAIPETRPQK